MKKINIELRHWDYECSDKCCFMYGCKLFVNGKELGTEYSGDNLNEAVELILKELGYEVEIKETHED